MVGCDDPEGVFQPECFYDFAVSKLLGSQKTQKWGSLKHSVGCFTQLPSFGYVSDPQSFFEPVFKFNMLYCLRHFPAPLQSFSQLASETPLVYSYTAGIVDNSITEYSSSDCGVIKHIQITVSLFLFIIPQFIQLISVVELGALLAEIKVHIWLVIHWGPPLPESFQTH